ALKRHISKKKKTERSTKRRGCFDRCNRYERANSSKSRAEQQRAEGKPLGKFVNAKCNEQRPIRHVRGCTRDLRFMASADRETVSRAMNRQGNDQEGGDLAKPPRGVFIEMAGSAGGTNVMDIFADHEK